MRLFSFQDQQGHHSLGALFEKDSSQYIDLCATDPNIPKDLQAQLVLVEDGLFTLLYLLRQVSQVQRWI